MCVVQKDGSAFRSDERETKEGREYSHSLGIRKASTVRTEIYFGFRCQYGMKKEAIPNTKTTHHC